MDGRRVRLEILCRKSNLRNPDAALPNRALLQDIGIHTKAGYLRIADKAEKELLKRAFWCLIYIDTYSSAALGRSLQMSAEE